MKNMKMQRKKINKNAIEAIIGVILMVAVTIAMAAAAYAYFTGMIGGGEKATPTIDFVKSDAEKTITVRTADFNVNWDEINITFTNETNYAYLKVPKTGVMNAGDIIDLRNDQILRGKVTVTIRHIPTNSILGTFTIENV
jgi:FlaG/FlaF family flagellin (archaellin)